MTHPSRENNHDYFRNYLTFGSLSPKSILLKCHWLIDSVDHKTQNLEKSYQLVAAGKPVPSCIKPLFSGFLRPDKFADKFKAARQPQKLPAINQTIKKNAPQNESSQRHLQKSRCLTKEGPEKIK